MINITRESEEDLNYFKRLLELSYTGSYIDDNDGVLLDRETRIGPTDRANGATVWTLKSGILLEDAIKVKKGDLYSLPIGLAGGLPVILSVEPDEDENFGMYVRFMMPSQRLSNILKNLTQRRMGFHVSMKLGSVTKAMLFLFDQNGRGFKDFLGKPWNDLGEGSESTEEEPQKDYEGKVKEERKQKDYQNKKGKKVKAYKKELSLFLAVAFVCVFVFLFLSLFVCFALLCCSCSSCFCFKLCVRYQDDWLLLSLPSCHFSLSLCFSLCLLFHLLLQLHTYIHAHAFLSVVSCPKVSNLYTLSLSLFCALM